MPRRMLWPDVPRLVFGSGDPPLLNARIEWVLSSPAEMTGYIVGYRDAAEAIYREAVARRVSPDFAVFPLAFLWRQHVELSLKEIIGLGRRLAGKKWGFPKGHGLLKLWQEARPYVETTGDSKIEPKMVEKNIREFEKIDPFGDGFRYPVNDKLTGRSLPTAPKHINLRVLHETLSAMANFLEGVRSVLQQHLDYEAEMSAYEP